MPIAPQMSLRRLRVMYSRKDTVLEEVHLNEAAQEVVTLSLAEFQRNGLTLRHEFAENLPAIDGDRVQLQQVILNLLLNACDAMKGVDGRARQIVLKTDLQQDGGCAITVVDPGQVSRRRMPTGSSSPSSPRRPAEWESAYTSAAASSNVIMGVCGQSRTKTTERPSLFRFRRARSEPKRGAQSAPAQRGSGSVRLHLASRASFV